MTCAPSEDLAARVANFRKQLAELDTRIAALAEQRTQRALPAASGEKEAMAAIKKLDEQVDGLRKTHETVISAIAAAERLQEEQRWARVEAERCKRAAQARRLA